MIGTRTKVVALLLGVLGILAYLVIVDLGVSAGRIHRGVSVAGIDVGGLTVIEAARELTPIGNELADSPLLFTASGADCRFTPRELGWGPQAFNTAGEAFRVGREDAPLGALWDRLKAWTGGIDVGWSGSTNAARVGRFLNECEERVVATGASLDRAQMRFRMKQAIGEWPYQQIHDLPLAD